ncbi:MAG TPA: hypothetical protein VFD37_00465 [Solirubrobacterales bacterium]|nr:hypothetical protein [Solirubrobacterales bacterium]
MPRRPSVDDTSRLRGDVLWRYFSIDGAGVTVAAWQPARDTVHFRATPAKSDATTTAGAAESQATAAHLEQAIGRLRFGLGVDDDLSGFYRRFRRDPLLGPLLRRRPDRRPPRLTSPWEALAWAIVRQLIEARRAATICRRIVGRWGDAGPGGLRDAPGAAILAGVAPAELESLDLAPRRSLVLRRVAATVARGRIEIADPAADRHLLAHDQVGPWTVACLGLLGRGEPDALPAGDLDYLKLVGGLAGLGRRAEIAEVEEFFEPYRPYRGLAGEFIRAGARTARAH